MERGYLGITRVCRGHGEVGGDHSFVFLVHFLVKCLLKGQMKLIASRLKVLLRYDLWGSLEDKSCCSVPLTRDISLIQSKGPLEMNMSNGLQRCSQSIGLCHWVLGETTPLFPSYLPFALLDSIWLDPKTLSPQRLSFSKIIP